MPTHSTVARAVTVLLLVASASASNAADRASTRAPRNTAKKTSVAAARAACAPCPASCARTSCSTTTAAVTAAAPAPASAGMVVGIDPETGALGAPTRQQLLELSAAEKQMISRSTDGLVEKPIPGGGFGIDLQGRFQEFSFVRIGPGGRLVFNCQNDLDVLRRTLVAPVQPALEDR